VPITSDNVVAIVAAGPVVVKVVVASTHSLNFYSIMAATLLLGLARSWRRG
jgi:hypothetical protein